MTDEDSWGDMGCSCCNFDDLLYEYPSPALDFIMGEAMEDILYPKYLSAEECCDLAAPLLLAMQRFGIQVEYPGVD